MKTSVYIPPPPIPWNARRTTLLTTQHSMPAIRVRPFTYSCVKVCAAPHAAEKTVNRKTASKIRGLRPKMSLNLDNMMRKPFTQSADSHILSLTLYLPAYVRRYDVTIQLLFSKPFKALVMATSAVLTIVVSIVERKRLRHKLAEFQWCLLLK